MACGFFSASNSILWFWFCVFFFFSPFIFVLFVINRNGVSCSSKTKEIKIHSKSKWKSLRLTFQKREREREGNKAKHAECVYMFSTSMMMKIDTPFWCLCLTCLIYIAFEDFDKICEYFFFVCQVIWCICPFHILLYEIDNFFETLKKKLLSFISNAIH